MLSLKLAGFAAGCGVCGERLFVRFGGEFSLLGTSKEDEELVLPTLADPNLTGDCKGAAAFLLSIVIGRPQPDTATLTDSGAGLSAAPPAAWADFSKSGNVPDTDRKPVGLEGFGGNAETVLRAPEVEVFGSSFGHVCDFSMWTLGSGGFGTDGVMLRLLENILGPGPEAVLTVADDLRGNAGLASSTDGVVGVSAFGALRLGPFALPLVMCWRGFASPSGDPVRAGVGADCIRPSGALDVAGGVKGEGPRASMLASVGLKRSASLLLATLSTLAG